MHAWRKHLSVCLWHCLPARSFVHVSMCASSFVYKRFFGVCVCVCMVCTHTHKCMNTYACISICIHDIRADVYLSLFMRVWGIIHSEKNTTCMYVCLFTKLLCYVPMTRFIHIYVDITCGFDHSRIHTHAYMNAHFGAKAHLWCILSDCSSNHAVEIQANHVSHLHAHAYLHVCPYTRMCVCVFVCVYICVCVLTHVRMKIRS